MDLRIFIEPQLGATYDDQLAVAQATERLGFDAFFRSDHYLTMGDVSGLPGPTDSWVTLAGLARETSRIRLGTLVTSATFRHPGPLAISVAQVDQMSGGRVELGIGAGWYEAEHRAHAIPFPPLGERFDRLEEQLTILTGMWGTPDRRPLRAHRSPLPGRRLAPACRSRHNGPGPRSSSAAGGRAARPTSAPGSASEFNRAFAPLENFVAQSARVREACEGYDRDPDELVYSAALVLCVGRDEAELTRARRGHRAPARRAPRQRRRRARARGGRHVAAVARGRRRRGSTCRCSTSPTSTTSSWSPPRSPPSSPDPTSCDLTRDSRS